MGSSPPPPAFNVFLVAPVYGAVRTRVKRRAGALRGRAVRCRVGLRARAALHAVYTDGAVGVSGNV